MTEQQFLLEMRRLLLAAIDTIERKAKLTPRTKEIRAWHKKQRSTAATG